MLKKKTTGLWFQYKATYLTSFFSLLFSSFTLKGNRIYTSRVAVWIHNKAIGINKGSSVFLKSCITTKDITMPANISMCFRTEQ